MFEDQTVDVNCPKCGHLNTILVREFEAQAETHFVCEGCKTGVKVEGSEFHDRLGKLQKELEELEREAARDNRTKGRRPRKGDFQI
jgi:transcription initiation factor IIE alpha subunit